MRTSTERVSVHSADRAIDHGRELIHRAVLPIGLWAGVQKMQLIWVAALEMRCEVLEGDETSAADHTARRGLRHIVWRGHLR